MKASCARRFLAMCLAAGWFLLLPCSFAHAADDTALLHETAQKTVELAVRNREVAEQVDLLSRKLARRLNGGVEDDYRERAWEQSCGCTGGLFARLAAPFFGGWESVIRSGVHTWSLANDMILRLSDVIGALADGIGSTADRIVDTEEGIGRMADAIGWLADRIVDVEETGFDRMLGFLGRDGVRSIGTGGGYLAADQVMLAIGADRELLVDRFELAASGRLDNPGPCCRVGDPIRPGIRWMGPQSREWFQRKLNRYAGLLVGGRADRTHRQDADERMGTLYPHAPVLIEAPVSGTAVTLDAPPVLRLRHPEAAARYLLVASTSPWFEEGGTVIALVEGAHGLTEAWSQVRTVARVGSPLYLSVQYLDSAYQASVMARPVELQVVADREAAASAPAPDAPLVEDVGQVTPEVRDRVADMLYETLLANSRSNWVTLDVAGTEAIEVPDVAAIAEWYAVETPRRPFSIPLARDARHLILLLWPADRVLPSWVVDQGFARIEAGPLADRRGEPYLLYAREVAAGRDGWSMPAIGKGSAVVVGVMQEGVHPTYGQLLARVVDRTMEAPGEGAPRDWLILHAQEPNDTDVGAPSGYRVIAAFDVEGEGLDHAGTRTRGVLTLALDERALSVPGMTEGLDDALPVLLVNVPEWRGKTVLPGERIHVAPMPGYSVLGFFHADGWGTRDSFGKRARTYSVLMVRHGLEDHVRLRLPAAAGTSVPAAGWRVAGRWKVSGRSMDSAGNVARESWMELLVRDLPGRIEARPAVNDPGLRMIVYRRNKGREIVNEADLRALLARSARLDRVRGVHVFRGLDGSTLNFNPLARDRDLLVRLTGRMRIPRALAGRYRFRLGGKGVLALRIDGRPVALVTRGRGIDHPVEVPRSGIMLAAGLHTVEFVHIASRDTRFRVEWRRSGDADWSPIPEGVFSHGRYDGDLDGIADFYDACLSLAGPPVERNGCVSANAVDVAVREGTIESTALRLGSGQAVYRGDGKGEGAAETWRTLPEWLDGARWFRTGHRERRLGFGEDYFALNLDIAREHLVFVALPEDARYPAWLLQQHFLPLPEVRIATSGQPRMLLFGRRVQPGMTSLRFLGVGDAAHNYSLFVIDPVHQARTWAAAEAVIRRAEEASRRNWLMAFASEHDGLEHGVPFGWREIAWFPVRGEGYDWRGKGTGRRLSLGLSRDARNRFGNLVVLVNASDHRDAVETPGDRLAVGALPGYSVLGYFRAPGDGVNDSFDTRNDGLTTVLVRKGFESFVRLVAVPRAEARFAMPGAGWTVTGFWGFEGAALDSLGRVVEDGWMRLEIRSLADGSDSGRTHLPGLAHSVWKRPRAKHPIGSAAWRRLALQTAGDADRLLGHAFRDRPGIGAPDRNPMGKDADYVTRFAGRLRIPDSGRWAFALDGSDSVELRIDGRVVTGLYGSHDADGRPHAPAALHLEAGYHHITLWQEEDGSGGALDLWWRRPGSEVWEPVPAAAFSRPLHDADRDGVADDADRCPSTLPGETVDAEGCAAATVLEALDAEWEAVAGLRVGDRSSFDDDDRFTALPPWAEAAAWYRFGRDVRRARQDDAVARMGFARTDRERVLVLLWPASAPYPQWPLQAGFLPLPQQGIASEEEARFFVLFRRVRDLEGPITLYGAGGGEHPWLLGLVAPDASLGAAMEAAERLAREARWLVLNSPSQASGKAHEAPGGYVELGWIGVDGTGFDSRARRASRRLSLAIRSDHALPSGLVRLLLPSAHPDRLAHPGERMQVGVEPGYRLIGMMTPGGDGVHDSLGAEGRAPAVIEVKAGYEGRVRLVAARSEEDGFVAPLPGHRLLGAWEVGGPSIDSDGRLIRRGLMSLQIAGLAGPAPLPSNSRPGALLETWRFETGGHPENAGDFARLAARIFAAPDRLRWGIGTLGDLHLARDKHANPFGDTGRMLTRLRARLHVSAAGLYRFAVDGDDAVELRINGAVVVGWYGEHGMKGRPHRTGEVRLEPGIHMLELLHESRKGRAGFTVYWRPPGSAGWQVVPGGRLSHGWADADLDAVPDVEDRCVETPLWRSVATDGCAEGQKPDEPAAGEDESAPDTTVEENGPESEPPPWGAIPPAQTPWLRVVPGASASEEGWVSLGRFAPREPAILYDRLGQPAYGPVEFYVHRGYVSGEPPVRLFVASAHRSQERWGRRRTVGAPKGYRVIGFWQSRTDGTQDPEGGVGEIVTLIARQGMEAAVRLRALERVEAPPLPGHEVVVRWYQNGAALDDRGRNGRGRWLSIEVPREGPRSKTVSPWRSGLRLDLYRFGWGYAPDEGRFIEAFVYPDALDELALSLWRNRIDPDQHYGTHHLARPEDDGSLGNPMGLSARYLTLLQGQLRIPAAGTYAFAVDADETVLVEIDGTRLTGLRGANVLEGRPRAIVSRHLEPGWHSLRLIHAEYRGTQGFRLYWRRPGRTAWEVLPEGLLRHAGEDADGDGLAEAGGTDRCPDSRGWRAVNRHGCTDGDTLSWRPETAGATPAGRPVLRLFPVDAAGLAVPACPSPESAFATREGWQDCVHAQAFGYCSEQGFGEAVGWNLAGDEGTGGSVLLAVSCR